MEMLPLVYAQDKRYRSSLRRLDRPKQAHVLENLVSRENLGNSTGSDVALNRVHQWLRACENHDRCSRARGRGFTPSRLLEVRQSDYRLALQTEVPSGVQYISLSYCWGQDKDMSRLQLTRASFDELHAGKPIMSLPKTYRDTMHLAKLLGIRYIWIDRLCIMQGDTAAWAVESRAMPNVYRNAYITVAALGAQDDQGGLFFERDAKELGPSIVHIRPDADCALKKYICLGEYTWPWKFHLRGSPLLDRAWVIQERLLSPRVVYFGRSMIYWECWQRSACEINPKCLASAISESTNLDSLDRPVVTSQIERKLKPLLEDSGLCCFTEDFEGCLHRWGSILAKYSQCSLTKPTDRLIAIQGLADHLKSILTHIKNAGSIQYLAGHWDCTIPRSLLWTALSNSKRIVGVAPSWSWASLDYSSVNPDSHKVPTARDIVYCSLLGVDFTSDQRSQERRTCANIVLRLRAPLFRVCLPCDKRESRPWAIKQISVTAILSGEELRLDDTNFYEAVVWYDEQLVVTPTEVYALPIMTTRSEHSFLIEMLLLTGKQREFKRIGIIRLWFPQAQHAATWLADQRSDVIMLA